MAIPTFHETQFPTDVSVGASGGPRFKTTILELASGFEHRFQEWANTRGEWDIGTGVETVAQYHAVLAFFYARIGRAYGFRFKDWSDYTIAGPYSKTEPGTPQLLLVGTGVRLTAQLTKVYTGPWGATFTRTIAKPVAGTLSLVDQDSNPIDPSTYSYDTTTGVVTFASAPPIGTDAFVSYCEFDVPARFDVDLLQFSMKAFQAGEVLHLPVVEIRPY